MVLSHSTQRVRSRLHVVVPVLIVFLVLVLSSSPTASAKPAAKVCENVQLSGKLPQPSKKGFTTQQIVTLNDDCTVKEGPIEEVPVSDPSSNRPENPTETLPAVVADGSGGVLNSSTLSGTVTALATFTNQTRSKSEIYDPAGILLTALYSNDAWSGDWTRITSYNVQSSASWHTEWPTFPGWNLVAKSTSGGCSLPCGSATFNQHAEFSYLGTFDPTGTLYYNIHNNSQTLNGNSSYSCTFSINIRRWFPGWSWIKGCA